MTDDREQQIRRRAYEIWERWGKMGTPAQNWFEAEIELELETKLASSDQRLKASDRTPDTNRQTAGLAPSGPKTKPDAPKV